MTPLPKRKHSTARQGKRRERQQASLLAISSCARCGKPRRSHHACPACGFYPPMQKTTGFTRG